MATTNMRIVVRRDTKANWDANSHVVLLQGEQGYEINVDKSGFARPTRVKVGDGVSQWGDLHYFNGGITDIDDDTIIMDATGKIMFNKDEYIGPITDANGDSVSVKDYVDTKVAVEAEARTNGDTALGHRIDELTIHSDTSDAALSTRLDVLEADPTTKAYVDGLIQAEAGVRTSADSVLSERITVLKTQSEAGDVAQKEYTDGLIQAEAGVRANMDSVLSQRIDTLKVESETADANEAARVDALIATDMWFFAENNAFPPADDNHGRVVHSHFDGAMFYSHGGMYHQLANEADLNSLEQEVAGNKLLSEQGDTALGQYIDSVQANLVDSVAAIEDTFDTIENVLNDVDSYVGNYAGGATISDDLVTLAEYNAVQDTVVSALIAGQTAFTGSVTAPGFNGDLVGNVTGNADTATEADTAGELRDAVAHATVANADLVAIHTAAEALSVELTDITFASDAGVETAINNLNEQVEAIKDALKAITST